MNCYCYARFAVMLAVMLLVMQPFLFHHTLAMMETLSPQFPFAQCGRPPREFLLLFLSRLVPGAQPASAAAEGVRLGGVLLEALPRRHRRSLRPKGVLPAHHTEGE